MQSCKLIWLFCNSHEYSKVFDTYDLAHTFMLECGLLSNPYIDVVKVDHIFYKGKP